MVSRMTFGDRFFRSFCETLCRVDMEWRVGPEYWQVARTGIYSMVLT
jgi:hypothetical protein